VHITELGGEYYRFDEVHQELRGERSGLRYAVGSRLRVQVSRVDLDGRRIDFRLVHDGEPAPAKGRGGERTRSAVDALAAVNDADRAGKAAGRKKARSPAAAKPSHASRKAAPRTRR
jgi:ribonuclease R